MGVEEQRAGKFYVERDVLDELCLDQVARRRTHSTTPPLKERVKDSLRYDMVKEKEREQEGWERGRREDSARGEQEHASVSLFAD